MSVKAPADLAVVDWSQPGRFRRLNDRFGPWGAGVAGSHRASRGPRRVRRRGCVAGGAAMIEIACPGWPASWVNAWLAAVGATVLDERIRLRWTTDADPTAVLSSETVRPGGRSRRVVAGCGVPVRPADRRRLARRCQAAAEGSRRGVHGPRPSGAEPQALVDTVLNDDRSLRRRTWRGRACAVRPCRPRNHQVASSPAAEGPRPCGLPAGAALEIAGGTG